jgi:hypothetical protein
MEFNVLFNYACAGLYQWQFSTESFHAIKLFRNYAEDMGWRLI